VGPYFGGGAAAVDAGHAERAVQGFLRARLGVLAHEGDDGGQVGGVSGEPGGLVVLGGAGLAGGGAADGAGGGAGAAFDDAAQDGGGGVGGFAADGLPGARSGGGQGQCAVACRVDAFDLLDEGVEAAPAVVGEGGVGLGHVEDAGGGGAERDGR
jgi:hypothetical protein